MKSGQQFDAQSPPEQTGIWDGVRQSYIPPSPLPIDDSLSLHRRAAEFVDPVTYEVVRYALMNINLEHNALIQKLAVSQVIVHGRDYQTAVLTEEGEVLFVGPGVQYFANTMSLSVQYTLEKRSGNPGIKAGDMFLCNDVHIGAAHQADTSVMAPVFLDGELFCWVSNALHLEDVGGPAPGSFCMNAKDAWDEPLNWPPIKIVSEGVPLADVEALFLRQSRYPGRVGMDLRAAIASLEYAVGRILELVQRYGPEVVKAVMYRTLESGEKLFSERLESIPDGRWSSRCYIQSKLPGDRDIYAYQINITKRGNSLTVDNRGTSPQAGSINLTYAGCVGAVLAGIMGQIVPDLAGAYGGPARLVDFRLEPGLLNCARFPAAVSPSGAAAIMTQLNLSALSTSKMLSFGNEEARERILGSTMPHSASLMYSGTDPDGEDFLAVGAEVMIASFGGSDRQDGYDFGGHWWIPNGVGGNVEDMEAQNPSIYLYRRGLPAGMDGSGRHRGGVGFRAAVTMLPSAKAAAVWTMNEAWSRGQGLWGAPPPSRSQMRVRYGSGAFEFLADSKVPTSFEEMSGETYAPQWYETDVPFGHGDVFEWVFPSMAGYGDPLRREPSAVLGDVRNSMLDIPTASRVFGVVIVDDEVALSETQSRRTSIRRMRLGGVEPQDPIDPPESALHAGDLLHVVHDRWWCNGEDLGPVGGNYKTRSIILDTSVQEIGPEFIPEDLEMADRVVFRQYVCPRTGYVIDSEICLPDDQPLHDVLLYPRITARP